MTSRSIKPLRKAGRRNQTGVTARTARILARQEESIASMLAEAIGCDASEVNVVDGREGITVQFQNTVLLGGQLDGEANLSLRFTSRVGGKKS